MSLVQTNEAYAPTTAALPTQVAVLEPKPTAYFDFTLDEENARLCRLVDETSWYEQSNLEIVRELLEGAVIACQMNLEKQLPLYRDKILALMDIDKAAHAKALTEQLTGYEGKAYYHPENRSLPNKSFTVPEGSRYKWVFKRIDDFGEYIPAKALISLNHLKGEGITPDGLWVADKKEQIDYSRWLTIDPLLYLQFGRVFVPIWEWA